MHRFIKNILSFGLGAIISALLGFLGTIVTARVLNIDQFAKYNIIVFLSINFSAVSILGYDQSITREYNEEHDTRKLIYNSLLMPMVVSLVTGIIVVIFSELLFQRVLDSNRSMIVLLELILYFCFQNVNSILSNVIRMQQRGVLFSLANIASKGSLLFLLVGISQAMGNKTDYKTVFGMTLISVAFAVFLELFFIKDKLSFNPKQFDREIQKKLFRFGLPLVPANFIVSMIPTIMLQLIKGYTSMHEVGIYSAALKLVNILTILQGIFSTIWIPVAYRLIKQEDSGEKFSTVASMISSVMFIMYVLVVLLRRPIVSILGGAYGQASEIIPLLITQVVFYTVSEVYIVGVYESRKTGFNIVISFMTALSCLASGYIFVRHFGITGAAISITIAYSVFFLIRVSFSRKVWRKLKMCKVYCYLCAMLVIAFASLFSNFFFTFALPLILLVCACTDLAVNLKRSVLIMGDA